MSDLGNFIRSKREEQGLSRADISKATAIRQQYLEILENGEFDKLPSYAHAYGFLTQYGKVLKLDFNTDIKPLFDLECCKETFGKTQEEIEMEKEARKKTSFQLPVAQIVAGVAVIVIIVVLAIVWGTTGFSSKGSASRAAASDNPMYDSQAAAPLTVDNSSVLNEAAFVPVVNDTASPVALAIAEVPAVVPATAAQTSVPFEVRHTAVLRFSDSCWVNFQGDADNATVLDFIAEPGQEKTISFNKFFRVNVGNAAAVMVTYNGKTFSGFGSYRQPAKNLYFYVDSTGTMTHSRTAPGA